MVNILNYITLSATASTVSADFPSPKDFSEVYKNIFEREKKSYLRHYVTNHSPFFVKDTPILFEQLAAYLADKLEINPHEVKLIGSAKTGFSMSPPPNYGKDFGTHSDLDFSIINEHVFNRFANEFSNWSKMFQEKQIKPQNETAESYWNGNLITGPKQIKQGFIDTHLIPNLDAFPTTKQTNNSLYLIKVNLDKHHSINIKKATASIYKNWTAFADRLNRNTESVMKKVK